MTQNPALLPAASGPESLTQLLWEFASLSLAYVLECFCLSSRRLMKDGWEGMILAEKQLQPSFGVALPM